MAEYKGEVQLLAEVPVLRARLIRDWIEAFRSKRRGKPAAASPEDDTGENDRLAEEAHERAEAIARAHALETAVRNRWIA